jgi:hypothetical protein
MRRSQRQYWPYATEDESVEVDPGDLTERRFSIEGAVIAGLVFAALYGTVQFIVTRTPSLLEPYTEVNTWYSDPSHRASLLLAFNLTALSSIAFLWFVAVVRRRIGEREDQFFATVFLSSGILFIALLLVGFGVRVAIGLVLSETNAVPDDADFAVVGGASNLILVVAMPRMQALFVASTSTIGRKTGALPDWLTWLGYAFALVLLVVPVVFEVPGLGFGLWVALVSGSMLVRRRRFD